MRKFLWITVPAGLLIAGAGLYLLTIPPPVSSNRVNLLTGPRHPVTVPMAQASDGLAGSRAADFTLPDEKGRDVRLDDVLQERPVLLVFTKDECPCSMEAQPFFNDLAKAYEGKVVFIGVMDSPPIVADKFVSDFRVPYRMLSASDDQVFRAYGSKQSAYVTLIGKDGVIVKQWPGYSRAMLADLNERLATVAETLAAPVDLSRAPEVLNSGCPFFKPVDVK